MTRQGLSQSLRLVVAATYVVYLLLLGTYLNDSIPPPFGLDGLWFYAAFAAIVLGELIVEPFFTRPADALANGLAVLIAAVSVSLDDAVISSRRATTGRAAIVGLALVVIAAAVTAMLFKDTGGRLQKLAGGATKLAGVLGRSRVLYSLLLFAVGYASFSNSGAKIAALYLSWFVILVVQPVEVVLGWISSSRERRAPGFSGVVESVEDPGTAVVRFPPGTAVELGQRANVGGTRGHVVDHTLVSSRPLARIALGSNTRVDVGTRVELEGMSDEGVVVGQVASGTSLDELRVEAVPTIGDSGVVEGRLLQVPMAGANVLYQVVGAQIERRQDAGLPREVVVIQGRKLGVWRPESTVFDPVPWIPVAGQEVTLVNVEERTFKADEIGQVPGTTYGVRIDVDLAVTHNTAILGILGIGKTHLAWELMARMLAEGVKVIALDITGQYADYFDGIFGPAEEERIASSIDEAIAPEVANATVRDQEAGNFREFDRAMKDLLKRFMASESRLLVINPARFDVSRMEGRPYQGRANFLSKLSMVDVTHVIAEHLLRLVQDEVTECARVCLVLEEAHSLVPEWNSTTHDSERYAANGTARAVLQGRKYGLGCLLITQRTANVTKSILNQCNTVCAMRIYDATGMGFLQNYIGSAHASLLATLPDRTAVVFGRASSCNAPIVVRLNDAEDFVAGYWDANRANVPVTGDLIGGAAAGLAVEAVDEAHAGEGDDDIPF